MCNDIPIIFYFFLQEGSGANFHGYFHHRNVHQNLGLGIHSAQKLLHEKPVEHNGLFRRRFWVSFNGLRWAKHAF